MTFKEAFKAELVKMAMASTFEHGFLDELTKLGLNKDENYGDLSPANLSGIPDRVTGSDPKAPKTTGDYPCPTWGPPAMMAPAQPSKPAAIEKAANPMWPKEGRLPEPVPGEKLMPEDKESSKKKFFRRMGNLADDVVMTGMNFIKKFRGEGI